MKKHRRLFIVSLAATVMLVGVTVWAQVARPYRNGSVWDIAMIRVKPGMDEAYMEYLCGQWKTTQEAMKKEGIILSYKVLTTEAHGTNDWNMLLMTEFKDLATMEASEDKTEALAQKLMGDDAKQMAGYKDRSEIRELMGSRLAREMVLEPKK